MIVVGGVDIIFGCLAFAACGNFQSVMDQFPELYGEYEVGTGWGLELLSGFIAWICAGLAIIVIIKGVGENSAVTEKSAEGENVA